MTSDDVLIRMYVPCRRCGVEGFERYAQSRQHCCHADALDRAFSFDVIFESNMYHTLIIRGFPPSTIS